MAGWMVPAAMVVSAYMGHLSSKEDAKQAAEAQKVEALKAAYGPLLGTQGSYVGRPNPWAKPVQGALQGASFAQSNKDLWSSKKSDNTSGEALAQLYGYGPTQDKARAMQNQQQQQQATPWEPLFERR